MAEIWTAGLSWERSGASCGWLRNLLGQDEFWSGSYAGSKGLGPVACEDAGGHSTFSANHLQAF